MIAHTKTRSQKNPSHQLSRTWWLNTWASALTLMVGMMVSGPVSAAPLVPIEITLVDNNATFYGTFQSHNQKIVSNDYGIFMTHIRTRNESFTAQQWRLSRSTNGGQSFTTVYEATHATNPPAIETDSQGNIYLVRADFIGDNASLYKFSPQNDFTQPVITTIAFKAGDKYSMMIDDPNNRLYFYVNTDWFHIVGLDGSIQRTVRLHREGEVADLVYPHLAMGDDGVLHTAWTSQRHDRYLYWDIHHMITPDGGATWKNLDGTILRPRIVSDHGGPALRITLDDEFDSHTWLSNFMVKDGKVHFVYWAQAPANRQHYMRYNVQTGAREIDHQPEFRGDLLSLRGLDGFFASRPDQPGSPLYYVSNIGNTLACLVSHDNGTTWYDFARDNMAFLGLYSIGGCRKISDDGYILGSFTATGYNPERVYFFKINTNPPEPTPTARPTATPTEVTANGTHSRITLR